MPVVAQPVKRARWLPGHALETVDLSSELGIEIGSHMLGWGGEVHDACGTWATVRGIDEDGCLLDMQATLMRHSTAIDTKNWPLFESVFTRDCSAYCGDLEYGDRASLTDSFADIHRAPWTPACTES